MKSFAVKHNNLDVRLNSRSGGCFTAISDYVLDNGGTVYGCKLNENLVAVHERATNREERNRFRGSKYVQSDKKEAFVRVKRDLQDGRWVLFSGTTCEVAGLKSYLANTDCSKLILVDILCHGVPSPLLWEKYKAYCEAKVGSPALAADFRNKRKFGWASHLETLWFQGGKEYSAKDFASIFYSHYGLRPSCYYCPYKSINHPSDFTLADCWGIDRNIPSFNDNKGVSLLLVNSEKASGIFEKVNYDLNYIEVDIKDYMQLPLRQACHINNRKRTIFWMEVQSKPFSKIIEKYGANSREERIKKIVNLICPPAFKDRLKKMLGR